MLENDKYTDAELITFSREGNAVAEEALASRYAQLVRVCARPFFLAGGDSEDLLQEGMIGLLSAIRNFDLNCGVSFRTYAEQCIRNRIISAITSASRQKHSPLNQRISFEYLLNEEPNGLQSPNTDFTRRTEDQVLAKEWEEELLVVNAKQLSRFEREVLVMYLQGLSCKEIAKSLNRPEKSIDNAVQRIRRKIMRDD